MENNLSFQVKNRTLFIELNEELVHHNAEYVRRKADNIIDGQAIKNIIMDFRNVSFMDSSGIGVIMGRYKKIVFNKGKIVLINVNKNVDRILTMSGLYRLVVKCDDLNSAMEILNERNN